MSRVEGSDKVGTRNREEMIKRESELIKKHKKEVRTIHEQHQNEMEKLKEDHSKTVDEVRNRNRTTMSEREAQYQEEIKQINELHRNHLRKAVNDEEVKKQTVEEALKGELTSQRNSSKVQLENLRQNMVSQLNQKDVQYSELVDQSRDSAKKSYDEQREKLLGKKEKEANLVRQTHDEKIITLQKDKEAIRQNLSNQLNESKRLAQTQVQKLSAGYDAEIEDERRAHLQAQDFQRKGFEASIQANKDKFISAENKGRQSREEQLADFKNTVNQRIVDRVENLEHKLVLQKKRDIADRERDRQLSNLEKRNVLDENNRALLDLQRQKNEVVDKNKDSHAREISRVRRQAEDLVGRTQKDFRHSMQVKDLKFEESLENQKNWAEQSLDHTERQSNERLRRLKHAKDVERDRMQEFFEKQLAEQTRTSDEVLGSERVRHAREMNQMQTRMNQELKKQLANFEERHAKMAEGYESQIFELRNRYEDEVKRAKEFGERRVGELSKNFDLQLKTTQEQNDGKMKALVDRYEKEMQNQEKRHQAQIEYLTNNMKAKA